ncbi:MAG: FAD-dependent oxidoreductase [Bacteroidetes bacterium]|nr:FAD-dependent oxidoreductase [Bacteroidota bacterium]MBT4970098.1 FAD-dependent oxidoreductase [Bacteroidota bacterium]MBT6836700.1 FAD-dependent oxidoreductase [Bacteroidota bacterium]
MIKLKINSKEIEVKKGSTILQAANSLGIKIPTMCYLEGQSNHPSCMMCVVKDLNTNQLHPSCAMKVAEGMNIITEDTEIIEARKDTLELLLSDHVGDCEAPCKLSCPANMDIPLMNRLIGEKKYADALKVVKDDIALPLILGYICSAPCEGACKRKPIDNAVSICQLKKFVAQVDLDSENPYIPEETTKSNKKLAIIGSGPTGLAASFYLIKYGHQVTVFDQNESVGGSLLEAIDDKSLPIEAFQKEIDYLKEYGIDFKLNTRIDHQNIESLKKDFDAVLLTSGANSKDIFNIETIEKNNFKTSKEGQFAAGSIIKPEKMAIRCVAQGKEVANAIDQYLNGKEYQKPAIKFNSKFGKLESSEYDEYLKESTKESRVEKDNRKLDDFSTEEAIIEAKRCMHCDCRKLDNCKLRDYSDEYKADRRKYLLSDRNLVKKLMENEGIVYEPEKCIRCGLCIDISSSGNEETGLAFIGRGFDVRVQVPFARTINEALTTTAKKCIEACPTGALAFK